MDGPPHGHDPKHRVWWENQWSSASLFDSALAGDNGDAAGGARQDDMTLFQTILDREEEVLRRPRDWAERLEAVGEGFRAAEDTMWGMAVFVEVHIAP